MHHHDLSYDLLCIQSFCLLACTTTQLVCRSRCDLTFAACAQGEDVDDDKASVGQGSGSEIEAGQDEDSDQ